MLIHCSKNRWLIFATRCTHTRLVSVTTSTKEELICWNHTWCKLKHAETCLYYDQVAWPPLSPAIKWFRELHSRAMCFITGSKSINIYSIKYD
jgi:hypothetical protein